MKLQTLQSGFTLIETLIYIAIVGITITSLVLFSVSVTNTRTKTYVVEEVQANMRVALDIIGRTIRSAESIDMTDSIFGTDPGVLVLRMTDVTKDPTIIRLNADDGIPTITMGSATSVPLMSHQVMVPNLMFTNLTASNTRESVRIDIAVAYNQTGTGVEYTYAQDMHTIVSVRK